jgi:hypothetical protein
MLSENEGCTGTNTSEPRRCSYLVMSKYRSKYHINIANGLYYTYSVLEYIVQVQLR